MNLPTSADPCLLTVKLAQLVPTRLLSSMAVLPELAQRWSERQRFWHGPDHVLTLLEGIWSQTAPGDDRDILTLAALYHDAVYNPRAADNEEASAALLSRHADRAQPIVRDALEIILDSKWTHLPTSRLGRIFFDLDTHQLSDQCSLSERLAYERAIFREYQWVPWQTYRQKRAEFLEGWSTRFPQHRRGCQQCIGLLAGLAPRLAVYPGSFNPFHLGHLSILEHAGRAFDKVIVALGVNRQKNGGADTLTSRQTALREQLPFHETVAFDGLLSAFIDDLDTPVTIVRGVRDGTDLEAELRYVRFLNELRPGTNVVWISCEPQHQHLSSSAIRELAAIQPGAEKRYLPDAATIYGLVAEGDVP